MTMERQAPMTPGLPHQGASGIAAVLPSTPDYLRFHGLHRPTSVALVANEHDITYRKFDSDLRKITRALRQIVGSARSVAVEFNQYALYVHWLLLLACENLGIATASFLLNAAYDSLMTSVDLVIAEQDLPTRWGWAPNVYKLTPAWVADALAQTEPDDGAETPNATRGLADTRRLVRSSATTGRAKMMPVSRAAEEAIVQSFILHMGFSNESKFLLTGGFNVGSMFWRATACLRLGATCVVERRMSTAHAIIAHEPTHVRLFQTEAKSILDELLSIGGKPKRLTVMMGAAPLPQDLRRRILAELATNLVYTYNSNETYMVAVVDADGVATVRPGADVEVIDDQDRSLPQGQVGRLKIRTDSLVDGYMGDPETTARVFRDGWFYSNDLGMLVGHRRLRLLGRADDMLNIGGHKIVSPQLEDSVVRNAPVLEAGATSVPGQDGIDEICIAVVPASGAEMPEIEQAIKTKVVSATFGRVHVMAMETLPRTETGKLQRHLLKAAFQQRLGR
jgi:acyl-coenzyme A synthetase/AMP-(fatty) acid ligase